MPHNLDQLNGNVMYNIEHSNRTLVVDQGKTMDVMKDYGRIAEKFDQS